MAVPEKTLPLHRNRERWQANRLKGPGGGIGRRARFRCVCREACRFESCSGHFHRRGYPYERVSSFLCPKRKKGKPLLFPFLYTTGRMCIRRQPPLAYFVSRAPGSIHIKTEIERIRIIARPDIFGLPHNHERIGIISETGHPEIAGMGRRASYPAMASTFRFLFFLLSRPFLFLSFYPFFGKEKKRVGKWYSGLS